MSGLDRIILHWTGGGWKANDLDRQRYQLIVEGDGTVVNGIHSPEDNIRVTDGIYGAHTRNLNTGSIGVAMAAMLGAQERPFSWGRAPLTVTQIDALCRLVAGLSSKYRIPVTRRTILTHAEVWPTLGIRQRGKWDITCLPGDLAPRSAVVVGDQLRTRIAELVR